MIDACAHSFAPTTSVAVSSGKVAIADLKVGDQVMAYDPRTGETTPHVVTAVMVNLDPATELLVTDAGPIETTPNHPFFTTDRGWVEAGELAIGEQIRTESGAPATVLSFTIDEHPASMWDLTVDGAHSFFAGSGAVLVHNFCPLGARFTNNWETITWRLKTYHGIDPETASARLHKIKEGIQGNHDVTFDLTGNVYDAVSGDLLGSLTQGGR